MELQHCDLLNEVIGFSKLLCGVPVEKHPHNLSFVANKN